MPATMYDGSQMLPEGTYVLVDESTNWSENAYRPPRTFIGRVVGTDVYGSKYHIGARHGGGGKWLFLEGGSWAFPVHVVAISEADALAAPEVAA